jgi:hypothetical protein
VDGNNKTLEDWVFTHRIKFGGTGTFDEDGKAVSRVLAFDVTGNSKSPLHSSQHQAVPTEY